MPETGQEQRGAQEQRGKGRLMGDLLLVLGFIAVWLLLQMVILPKLGVST